MAKRHGIKRTMGPVEWLLLATLSVLWGGSFFFAEVALAELRPLTVVLCRVGFAALVLVALVYATGRRLPCRASQWRAFFAMGGLNNLIPFILIVWGQTHIASGLASILNATTPVFTVVLAHLLTRDERMTPNRLAGVLLGLAGVAVMIGPEALEGLGPHLAAQLAVLGAALSYAFAGIYGRRFQGEPPLVVAAGQVTASSALVLPLALVVDRPWTVPLPGAETWAAIAGLAVLSTALAYVIFFRILAAAGATNLLLVTLLIPVSAILLGTLVLGERLEAGQLAGMAVIGLGLLAIDGRPLQWLRAGRGARYDTRTSKGERLDRED
jgi:drug/metabolite transporter (DMT)-like permease